MVANAATVRFAQVLARAAIANTMRALGAGNRGGCMRIQPVNAWAQLLGATPPPPNPALPPSGAIPYAMSLWSFGIRAARLAHVRIRAVGLPQ